MGRASKVGLVALAVAPAAVPAVAAAALAASDSAAVSVEPEGPAGQVNEDKNDEASRRGCPLSLAVPLPLPGSGEAEKGRRQPCQRYADNPPEEVEIDSDLSPQHRKNKNDSEQDHETIAFELCVRPG